MDITTRATAARRLGLDPDVVLEGLATEPGDAFLRWFLGFLGESAACDLLFVGELPGESRDRLRPLAVQGTSLLGEGSDYDIRHTPCASAVAHGTCIQPRAVTSAFPDAPLLAALGAEAYVGQALLDERRSPRGLVSCLYNRPIDDATARRNLELVLLFRPRLEAELIHRRALRQLQCLFDGAAGSTRAALDSAATALARALGVRVAFVSRFVGPGHRRMRTSGMCIDGELVDDVEYDIAGTPCDVVRTVDVLFHPSAVREAFPAAPFLAAVQAESYLAFPLTCAQGTALGHLGVIHDRPLPEGLLNDPLLRVVTAWARSELERRQADERRLQLERRLLEAQRTESLGILAGGVAHDFANLLTAIEGNTTLLRRTLSPDAPERAQIEEIDRAGRQAMELCRRLLDYAHRQEVALEPVVLDVVVRELVDLIEGSLSAACRLEVALTAGDLRVEGDETQLQQVVLNLVLNAVEALGAAGGGVRVRTGRRAFAAEELATARPSRRPKPGPYAFLEVADDGCGMTPEVLERIYDPFFTTKTPGRGLGLAAILEIVRGHGGQLLVGSAPGEGTTFTVALPPLE